MKLKKLNKINFSNNYVINYDFEKLFHHSTINDEFINSFNDSIMKYESIINTLICYKFKTFDEYHVWINNKIYHHFDLISFLFRKFELSSKYDYNVLDKIKEELLDTSCQNYSVKIHRIFKIIIDHSINKYIKNPDVVNTTLHNNDEIQKLINNII